MMLSGLMNKIVLMLAVILSLVFLFAAIKVSTLSVSELPELVRDVAVTPEINIESVNLIDHRNNIVNTERFKNHWTFVFFGYTNCPDVCPATIAQLKLVKKGIQEDMVYADNTQFFFVSVDPERDSLDHLHQYMQYFDSTFIGMTGDEQSIAGFEKQLGSFHRIGAKTSQGDYTVQHSAEIYLIDSKARLVAKFQPPMKTERIVKQFIKLVSMQDETLS